MKCKLAWGPVAFIKEEASTDGTDELHVEGLP